MASFQELSAKLDEITRDIASLKDKGYVPYPAPFVLDSSTAKGRQYYRKRDRRSDGSPGTSSQIDADTYAQLRDELARGKQIHKLEKQRSKLAARMDAIASVLAEMSEGACNS